MSSIHDELKLSSYRWEKHHNHATAVHHAKGKGGRDAHCALSIQSSGRIRQAESGSRLCALRMLSPLLSLMSESTRNTSQRCMMKPKGGRHAESVFPYQWDGRLRLIMYRVPDINRLCPKIKQSHPFLSRSLKISSFALQYMLWSIPPPVRCHEYPENCSPPSPQ